MPIYILMPVRKAKSACRKIPRQRVARHCSGGDSSVGISYKLAGTDGQLFSIDQVTGDVFFKTAPDFEQPLDADKTMNIVLKRPATMGKGRANGIYYSRRRF